MRVYAICELFASLCNSVFCSVCLIARLSAAAMFCLPVATPCNLHPPAAIPPLPPLLPFAEIWSRFGQTTTPSCEVRSRALPQYKTCTWVSSGLMGCWLGCWRWPTFSGQSALADCVQIWAEMPTATSTTATRSGLGGVPARPGQPWTGGSA